MTDDSVRKTSSGVVDISFDQPSTSYIVSSRKILPSPKVIPIIKKLIVKCQKSDILTSSPYKATTEKKNELRRKPKFDLY